MARHVFVFPVAAEPRHARDDEARVLFEEDGGGAETESFKDTWSERVDKDVSAREEREQDLLRAGVVEVQDDGCFMPCEKVGRRDRRGCGRSVDAEDRCAVVSEKKAGKWTYRIIVCQQTLPCDRKFESL